jgi:uncharacterized membrane protein YhaH (DUF805 family)
MRFFEAVGACFEKFATFSGRAPRSEYWWFYLFTFLAGLATIPIDALLENESVSRAVSLAFFVPSIAVGSRRLHDIGRTGWLQALPLAGVGLMFVSITLGSMILLASIIFLIVLFCLKGTRGPNRYGDDPLDTFDPAVFE